MGMSFHSRLTAYKHCYKFNDCASATSMLNTANQ